MDKPGQFTSYSNSGHAGEAESSIAPDILSEAQTFSIIFEQPGTTHTSAYYIQIW